MGIYLEELLIQACWKNFDNSKSQIIYRKGVLVGIFSVMWIKLFHTIVLSEFLYVVVWPIKQWIQLN